MTRGRYAVHRGMVAHHVRRRRPVPARAAAVAAGGVLIIGAVVALGVLTGQDGGDSAQAAGEDTTTNSAQPVAERPPGIDALPVPQQSGAAPTESPTDACASAASVDVTDTADYLAAFGGAEAFREAAAGGSDCIALDDPTTTWFVVNKTRPLNPVDFAPEVKVPDKTPSIVGGGLRPDAADALDTLSAAISAAGAGDIALQSGYRSYQVQVDTFNNQVGALGEAGAEAISARPGFSEHQTGLAADVVACANGNCGTIYDIAGTAQGDWLAENSWQYGWIVRYEDGYTDISGYNPEPWHLRYIGVELAKVYHDGGYHTLEDFFGLPAAPDYAQ
ncbi:MAG: M15 family metallopeptidase [Microbacterium sp.]